MSTKQPLRTVRTVRTALRGEEEGWVARKPAERDSLSTYLPIHLGRVSALSASIESAHFEHENVRTALCLAVCPQPVRTVRNAAASRRVEGQHRRALPCRASRQEAVALLRMQLLRVQLSGIISTRGQFASRPSGVRNHRKVTYA